MRIPPYFHRKGYQRFFAGIVIGFLLGWVFFLVQFGMMQEYYVTKIHKQKAQIEDLQNAINLWKADYQKHNEEVAKAMKIQDIRIRVSNKPDLRMSELTILKVTQLVENELEHLIGQDIETVAKSQTLLFKTIENKEFSVDDQVYQVKIDHLYLYKVLEIHVDILPVIH